MYAVLAEDTSDVETLTTLIKRIANNNAISVKGKGYSGCSGMLLKGARDLRMFHDMGRTQRYVVCYDSDGCDPVVRRQELIDRVIGPSGVMAPICALVPTQEMESWILADVNAVQNVITGWVPDKDILHPESIDSPKEYLEKMSRLRQRPRYSHATHNSKIAKYLDIAKLLKKCPSFAPLYELVTTGKV